MSEAHIKTENKQWFETDTYGMSEAHIKTENKQWFEIDT